MKIIREDQGDFLYVVLRESDLAAYKGDDWLSEENIDDWFDIEENTSFLFYAGNNTWRLIISELWQHIPTGQYVTPCWGKIWEASQVPDSDIYNPKNQRHKSFIPEDYIYHSIQRNQHPIPKC